MLEDHLLSNKPPAPITTNGLTQPSTHFAIRMYVLFQTQTGHPFPVFVFRRILKTDSMFMQSSFRYILA